MLLGSGGTSASVDGSDGPCVAGVDEAGRGPLAGPVVAAAVILRPGSAPDGIADSKRLSRRQRERLAVAIRTHALAWSVAGCSVAEIDAHNILGATLLAMRRALEHLPVAPACALVDGNRCPDGVACATHAVVGGDALEPAIGAASILAKTVRDACMAELHHRFPGYGFDRHKGYPTRDHLLALRRYGPCAEHRRSFAPVRQLLQAPELPLE